MFLDNNIFKIICFSIAMVCITAIVLNTKNTALMWWYVLPVLVFGIDINVSNDEE